ncbi:hypothetical protein ABID42_000511 [Arcicella rosea]|uniref:glycosyltransferase n=1 Tax=Arcicella rosea TaxID=502909 RepID=UPI00345CDC48
MSASTSRNNDRYFNQLHKIKYNMLPEYDLFIFSLSRSDSELSSVSVALAKEWSKTHRVFYIDKPYSVKDVIDERKVPGLKKRLKAILVGSNIYDEKKFPQSSFIQVTPRISLPINFLPQGAAYNFLNRYNNFVVNEVIKKIIKDYDVKNYVFINSFYPVNTPVISHKIRLKPLANIYQSFDMISEEPYIAKHGIKAEFDAIMQCDIAIATSTGLCDIYSKKVDKKIHFLSNGVDYEVFANAINKPYPMPKEMKGLKGPIIIYTGHYSNLRIDYELLKKITDVFKEGSILFVGTYDKNDIDREHLSQIKNLYFIGPKPIESLPAYLCHSNAAIIPYKKNNLTKGVYPLKMNEYLAAGIPTVSTDFSDDIFLFEDLIYLSSSHEDFIDNIKIALEEEPQKKLEDRMQRAEENSWRKRIQKLEEIIEDFLKINT